MVTSRTRWILTSRKTSVNRKPGSSFAGCSVSTMASTTVWETVHLLSDLTQLHERLQSSLGDLCVKWRVMLKYCDQRWHRSTAYLLKRQKSNQPMCHPQRNPSVTVNQHEVTHLSPVPTQSLQTQYRRPSILDGRTRLYPVHKLLYRVGSCLRYPQLTSERVIRRGEPRAEEGCDGLRVIGHDCEMDKD